MNLLGILLKAFLSDSAIKALVKKTGLSQKQLKKLLPLAVPLLIKMLTKNASQKDGALSLLGALAQHTNRKRVEEQIEEADSVDGGKIIGHILGKDKDQSLLSLSNQSGLSQQQVSSVLSGIAPALLSGLSLAASGSSGHGGKVDLSDGLDLGEVLTLLSGGSAAAQPKPQSKPGLLGSLFGKKPAKEEQDVSLNGAALLQALLQYK